MRKNWFYRMLFSYLPIIFVVSLSLILITYLTLNEMSKRSAIKANEMLSHSILQSIDNMLVDIEQVMEYHLFQNDKIKAFFQPAPERLRQYMDYEAAKVLDEFMLQNEFIDSIYLYRSLDEIVITHSTATLLEGFGDKYIIGKYIDSLVPFRWLGARMYTPKEGEPPRKVITLIKFGNLSNSSLMVVNVSVEQLQNQLKSMTDLNPNFFELVDHEQKLITTKHNQSNDESAQASQNGRVLTEIESSYTGWKLVSKANRTGLLEWVSLLFYIWIGFGVIIILGSIVWLVYVTKKNYRPIQGLLQRFNDDVESTEEIVPWSNDVDELQYIGSAIDDLLDKKLSLQAENKQNLVYRKMQTFQRLMAGTQLDRSWDKELKELGLNYKYKRLVVSVIEIDEYYHFCKEYNVRDQALFKQVLSSVLNEVTSTSEIEIWHDWIADKQLAVLIFLNDDSEDDEFVDLLTKLVDWVDEHLPFTVTVGVGHKVQRLDDVHTSYRTSSDAIAYKASLGMNRLIVQADLQVDLFDQVHKYYASIVQLCQSFRLDNDEWKTYFESLYDRLSKRLFRREDLVGLHMHLINSLDAELKELPEELQEWWHDGVESQLLESVDEAETLEAFKKSTQQALQNMFAQMQDLRASRNNYQLIRNVKQYIQENYHNPELSLTHLSDEFGLGASYLSRLFKETFGVRFIDYVTEARMEKAEELLRQTNESVQDIAIAVGYNRALTFIRVFKKYAGNTPGNFRKSLEE